MPNPNPYANPFVRLGSRLFRWRRLFYGIPIFILLVDRPNLYFPFSSHFDDEVIEFLGVAVALAGAALRFWASGSAARSVSRKSKRFHFHSTGPYSLMRHPHFAGDLLIVAGLSFPLMNITFML